MPDKIFLEELVFYGFHGVRPPEGELGQRFGVDLELTADLQRAARTDDLDDTVSYSRLYTLVRAVVEGPACRLLETLAERIADAVLDERPDGEVRVRVRKLAPPIRGTTVGTVGVEIVRRRTADGTATPRH